MEEYLLVEKYRPKTVEDTILPSRIKKQFLSFVESGSIPNLLLSGPSGVGKTTIAKAMLEQLGVDYLVINGSLDRNIDTLRVEISNFASSVSFTSKKKYVIIDESDYLNAQSFQPALRNFIEKYSNNCGFILTCNFKNKIIEPLHSRCSVIEFDLHKDEVMPLIKDFLIRLIYILKTENIEYDKKVLVELIKKYMPDWRRLLNEIQRYSYSGKIDVGILSVKDDTIYQQLIEYLKSKKFDDMRVWVAENMDIDAAMFYKQLYQIFPSRMDSSRSLAQSILTLAEYQYKESFVANPEINRVAALTEIMSEASWKS